MLIIKGYVDFFDSRKKKFLLLSPMSRIPTACQMTTKKSSNNKGEELSQRSQIMTRETNN